MKMCFFNQIIRLYYYYGIVNELNVCKVNHFWLQRRKSFSRDAQLYVVSIQLYIMNHEFPVSPKNTPNDSCSHTL